MDRIVLILRFWMKFLASQTISKLWRLLAFECFIFQNLMIQNITSFLIALSILFTLSFLSLKIEADYDLSKARLSYFQAERCFWIRVIKLCRIESWAHWVKEDYPMLNIDNICDLMILFRSSISELSLQIWNICQIVFWSLRGFAKFRWTRLIGLSVSRLLTNRQNCIFHHVSQYLLCNNRFQIWGLRSEICSKWYSWCSLWMR
jgi:hypothetical protein